MTRLSFTAAENHAGLRLDVFLAEQAGLTRSAAQKLIEQGGVTCNDRRARNNFILREGDGVVCQLPSPATYEASPEIIPLDIIYEDSHVIVVNKPRGLVVHPAPGHSGGTLVNALLYHCGASLSGINGVMRPGIVHRIDKDTSGLLVAAKNDAAHLSLTAQLAAHTMRRTYLALCHRVIKPDALTIDQPIGRHPADRKKMAVVTPPALKSRRAVTHITVLERLARFTLIEARLETGRTHQIRVHLAHAGHPLVGDPVYGAGSRSFNLGWQMLHATCLGFTHPASGEPLFFEAPTPDDFAAVLEKARRG